jgi:hypothetical protein
MWFGLALTSASFVRYGHLGPARAGKWSNGVTG